jgi:hypothetical protein
MRRYFGLGLLLWVLSGCADTSVAQTLAVQQQRVATQVMNLETTATIQAARLETTLDFVGTRVALAATQSQFLKSTLIVRGTPQALLDQFQQQVSQGIIVLPTATPRPTLNVQPNVTAVGVQPAPQPSPITALSVASPFPTPAPDAPRLENVVLASSVGADNCAVNPALSFPVTTNELYVVANGYQLSAGTNILARWRFGEQEFSFDFDLGGDTNGECLWLYIDQSTLVFPTGNASVTLEINGVPATPPLVFTLN